mgnify:CR=1 FL=1
MVNAWFLCYALRSVWNKRAIRKLACKSNFCFAPVFLISLTHSCDVGSRAILRLTQTSRRRTASSASVRQSIDLQGVSHSNFAGAHSHLRGLGLDDSLEPRSVSCQPLAIGSRLLPGPERRHGWSKAGAQGRGSHGFANQSREGKPLVA